MYPVIKSFRRHSNTRGQVRHESTFEIYFAPDRIIRELCRARVKWAERRNEALFLHNIDRSQPSAEEIPAANWGDIPTDIFPPRKSWNRYRRRSDGDNLETLVCAVRYLSRETPEATWARHLADTVEMIRERALSQRPFVFSAPRIVPEVKDRDQRTYRPLASFVLSDKIIDCLTARYFREKLDSALLGCCLAFRSDGDGRHNGLDMLLRERQNHNRLFVAECDIRGFFDCVSHAVARRALSELIADAEQRQPNLNIHPRAVEIFDAYLSCYSFLRNVRRGAELELQANRGSKANYPWSEPDLRRFHGSALDGIGVPQGGALSGVIANAVLHSADKRLDSLCAEHQVTYLRYCDDMILLSPDRDACAAAFDSYRSVVTGLRLPIHPSPSLRPYEGSQKKFFWNRKSRPVYKWGDPSDLGCYPWIQFLGYQIRYDGMVRIRQSSVDKELRKLADVSGRVLSLVKSGDPANIRCSPSNIAHRFRMKLISMGVGRRSQGQPLGEPSPNCWTYGFRWLLGKNCVTTNLMALDRQRERQINRVVRRLKGLRIPETGGQHQTRARGFDLRSSYFGQLLSKGSKGCKTPMLGR
jgi:hypothetical protein